MSRSTPRCQWAGHGRNHHGPVAFELTLGRPCGHDTQGPIPTCFQQGLIMLAEGGRAHVESRCTTCGEPSRIQVIDPAAHPATGKTTSEEAP